MSNMLDGVTIDAEIGMARSGNLKFKNGLVLTQNATIVGSPEQGFSITSYKNNDTIAGSGRIVLGGNANYPSHVWRGDGVSNVTIGPGITIATGENGYGTLWGVTNQGMLLSEKGGYLEFIGTNQGTIAGSGTLVLRNVTNSGLITKAEGGYLTLAGSFNNTGVVSATDTQLVLSSSGQLGDITATRSQIAIDGRYTTDQIRSIKQTDSRYSITANGVLDNTGDTLAINEATGSWDLLSGTIKGGMVTTRDGMQLRGTGTLQSVSMDGDLLIGARDTITSPRRLLEDCRIDRRGWRVPACGRNIHDRW